MLQKLLPLNLKMNKLIKFMIYSDLIFQTGWGLINPIIAVFITDQITGADVAVVGIAATIYLVVQSIIQIPISHYIDSKKGEFDDYRIMIVGSVLLASSAFLYIFAKEIWHVYLIQIVGGIGAGLSYPGWVAIFTRHIDKNREGFEWSFYSTLVNLGTALTAAIGGLAANAFGYKYLFLTVGILSIIGTLFLFFIHSSLKKK